jgi:serine/threonine-protein kinase
MTLTIGSILIKRYRMIRLLGEGSYGAVYLAEDTRLNRQVAIKEASGGKQEDRQRATEEAIVMAALDHPNLVKVLDTFSENSNTYVVMQFIDGHDLMKEAELAVNLGRPLPTDRVLLWIEQVCSALAYLHKQDIVHRDVKPNNMRLRQDGTVVLIDLGIAKRGVSTKTGRLQKAFTPMFAPPEQCTPNGSTTYASDVYALGMTMYVLLTAQMPPTALERTGDPPAVPGLPLVHPTLFNPAIPPVLERIILKATALSSTMRYKDAGEMMTELQTLKATGAWNGNAAGAPAIGVPNNAVATAGYVSKFCPRCGKRNTSHARFCTACGFQLARPQVFMA